MRYVIIGGGIAGTTAAEELRKLDPTGEITIVSEEQHAIYSRVLLPHYLKGKVPRERVFLKKESWYEEQQIEWLRGESVVELDPKNSFVRVSSGREIEYDRVLIATGGELKTLPDDPRGVSYFRTLDDADHLAQLLSELKPGAQAGIYGGGFIACEYINLFAHFGLETQLAIRGDYFWSSILDPKAGELINTHLEKNGVKFFRHAAFEQMLGETELEGFQTSVGTHTCQILGIGIGIQPELSVIKVAGVECGHGVRTNEFLETNLPNVFAAGDVTEFYDVVTERHLHTGNWMNAMTQGRIVAKNMFGTRTKFELVSSYSTNALGLEIIFVGDTSKEHADEIQLLGSVEEGGITQLFMRDSRLVGGVMIGRNKDRAEVTNAIKERRLFQQIPHPNTP